jgi:hypothetical protein
MQEAAELTQLLVDAAAVDNLAIHRCRESAVVPEAACALDERRNLWTFRGLPQPRLDFFVCELTKRILHEFAHHPRHSNSRRSMGPSEENCLRRIGRIVDWAILDRPQTRDVEPRHGMVRPSLVEERHDPAVLRPKPEETFLSAVRQEGSPLIRR